MTTFENHPRDGDETGQLPERQDSQLSASPSAGQNYA